MKIRIIIISLLLIIITSNIHGQRIFSDETILGRQGDTENSWIATDKFNDSKFIEFNRSFTILTIIDITGESIYRITEYSIIDEEVYAIMYSRSGLCYKLYWNLNDTNIVFVTTLGGRKVVTIYNVVSIKKL